MPRFPVLLLCCGVLSSALGEPVVRATLPSADANAVLATARIPAEGLALTLRPAATNAPEASMALRIFAARPSVAVTPRGALGSDFPDRVVLTRREGKDFAATHTVTLKRRARGWSVYVDDTPCATFPDRFSGPVEVLHEAALVPAPRTSPEAEGDQENGAYVQRTAPFLFTDAFLVDTADVEGAKLNHWDKYSGTWLVHSIATDAEANPVEPRAGAAAHAHRRKRSLSAEHSPNFYCVEGSGTNAFLLAGYDFQDRYTLAAAVHLGEGENGLAFLVRPDGACHAFTGGLRRDGKGLRFTLWRSRGGSISDREVLAQYDTDLLPGQWHRLSARVLDDRVAVSVNGIQLGCVVAPLPPGGRYGLFAHGPEATRFDDVAAASHEELEFATAEGFERTLLHRSGDLDRRRGALPVSLAEDEGATPPNEHIALAATSREPGLAIFGTTIDAAHVVATAVWSEGRPFEAALLAGWQGPDAAALRFVVAQTPTNRVHRLEWAVGGVHATGELARLVLPLTPSRDPLQLMLDATPEDGVRAFVDGRMVLVAPGVRRPTGASGLVSTSSRSVEYALPLYRSERRVYRSKVEKTTAFAQDPFMREWASPEGEWVRYPDGKTWFKGDRFGAVAVHQRWKQPTELFLAVPENAETGPYSVATDAEGLRLVAAAQGEGAKPETIASVPLRDLEWAPQDDNKALSNQCFTVRLEDHALWVTSGDRVLFLKPLPELLPGRRMRVEGLATEDLHRTRVERTGIADFLFTDSLHEWTLNGGRWEVVNRFACDPRWSHLNGQNADSVAALWSRYEFEGDFCAELYAGMRMGWYDRPGDLNLTILGSAESPASGYTFTCTGWDVDESQLQSRLFRNGELLATSDKYMVPRVREGSVRRGYSPLLSGGRDLHGAWYYTRLRRTGDELQVAFDNEPALSVRDPAPLAGGGFGIWTYRNSMVVARVRMAAEHIRPKRFAVHPVLAAKKEPTAVASPWPAECAEWVGTVAASRGLDAAALPPSPLNPRYPGLLPGVAVPATTNEIPLAPWTPDTWTAADDVSHARFEWRPSAEARDLFVMTARQAAGSFFASNALPVVPLRCLAGWRFETARTADAQYNFHYTVGRMTNGAFEPAQRFVHVLSGSDEARGPMLRTGATTVPAAKDGGDPVVGPWADVSVWLPAFPREEETLWVRVDGFGNLNASDVQQGLLGNLPGAAYAVRNFAPILLGEPVLAKSGMDAAAWQRFAAAVASRRTADVHRLPLPETELPQTATVHWVLPPANLELTASWSSEFHDAVDIRSAITWPVRHLKGLAATVNGRPATVVPREGNRLLVLIPRDVPPTEAGLFQVDLATSARRPVGWGLPTAERTVAGPPVLVALESDEFRFENHELIPPGPLNGTSDVRPFDARQGRHLRTANGGEQRRLSTVLAGGTDLVRNPVLQFRHRGEGLVRVSVRAEPLSDVAFTETPPHTSARTVRGYNPGTADRWQTWTGILTDHLPERAFNAKTLFSVNRLLLASGDQADQTGRYATLWVDDIVAGPAVGPNRPLRITPKLFDLDGDGFVEWALLSGIKPYVEGTNEPSTEVWHRLDADAVLDVPFDGLADGVHHVLFRPASPRGRGTVEDVPFLLDTAAPSVAHRLDVVPNFGNGTRLSLQIGTGGGSLPQYQSLKLTCNDRALDLAEGGSQVAVEPEAATLCLDWPLLLQPEIQSAKDGDTLQLRMEGLIDGAGNSAEPYSVPIPIQYANDKTPPTLRSTVLPGNIAWMTAWHEPIYAASFRVVSQAGYTKIPAKADKPASLQIYIGGTKAYAMEQFENRPWNLARFPLLAFRIGFAKLPAQTTPEAVSLTLMHRVGDSAPQPLSTPLFVTADKLPPEFRATVDWSVGGVSEFVVNVHDLARRLANTQEPGQIVGVRFDFANAAGAQFQIHQVAIFAPWGPDNTFAVRAYDASGVDGVVWQDGGRVEGTEIRPAQLGLPAEALWLRLQVRDRAGNTSPILHLPALSAVVPVPGAPAP